MPAAPIARRILGLLLTALAGCGGGSGSTPSATPTSPATAPVPAALQASAIPAVIVDSATVLFGPRAQLVNSAGATAAVAGVVVTAAIATGDPAATLSGATAATSAAGLAVFGALRLHGPSGPYTLRFSSPGLPTLTTTDTIALLPARYLVLASTTVTTEPSAIRILPDGGESTVIGAPGTPFSLPHYAADGSRVVFTYGDELRVWTPPSTFTPLRDATFDIDGGGRFSADGLWLYFVSQPAGSSFVFPYRMHPDGSGRERLTFDARDMDPHPDSVRLAYLTSTPVTDLIVRNMTTGATVTFPRAFDRPRWSPAGDRLAGFRGSWVLISTPTGVVVDSIHAPAGSTSFDDGGLLAWSSDARYLLGRAAGRIGVTDLITKRWVALPVPGSYTQASWQR
ncbi:MAG: PD40 domain-containing protein [Gemmatimonadetes bacterium]|nr:PD40 domain-containing protein [Gemmatimonadota bacterium]